MIIDTIKNNKQFIIQLLLSIIIVIMLWFALFSKKTDSFSINKLDEYKKQNDSLKIEILATNKSIKEKLDSIKIIESNKTFITNNFIHDTTYVNQLQNTDSIISFIRNKFKQLKQPNFN